MLTVLLQSATECSSTTLAQIIDLYVQLQNHDGVDGPAPLYLALSTKVKFSHRFDFLLTAVAEGKGLSQLMLLESAEEGAQHSDNQLEQEIAQGSYPRTPKPISGAEPETDPPGDLDADEVAEEEPDLTHEQLEDLKPDTPQHYEVGGQTDVPPAEAHAIATHAILTGENQTSTGYTHTLSGGPNNMHQAGDPINGPSQSDLTAIPIADKNQDAVEERDLISYEDEDNLNPGSSTGSSTVQGDVREVNIDSSNRVSGEPATTTNEDVTSTRRDLESDSTSVLLGRSSTPSFPTDVIEDDFDYAAHLETTEERPSDDAVHDGGQKLEDEPEHHPKTDSAADLRGYGRGLKEVRNSSEVPEQEFNVSIEASFDEDPDSLYTLMDSNIGTKITRTDLTELDIQQSAGSGPLVSELDGASSIKHCYTTVDSNRSVYKNATDSSKGDQYGTDGDLTGQFADRALYGSTSQNLQLTSNAQEQLADSDEITYEDDGNELEPSKVYGSEQNPNSSPGLLKRMRSDHEDHDEIESSVQGELNCLVSVSPLITRQIDAKRHRPG